MEYITSRGHEIPNNVVEFEADLRFHLWRNKLWPYQELVIGDILYWYETPSQSIVWKSKVVDVERFPYNNKDEVRRKLIERFHNFDETESYFVKSPETGYCLALKVRAVERVNFHKPTNILFPQQGWLKINDDIVKRWLVQAEEADETTLDDIVTNNGSLLEKIQQINSSMKYVSPERVASIVSRTVRKDSKIVNALKVLCEFKCQYPGCTARIPTRSGSFYVEVAHVRPVSKGGQSVIGNLLVLCPNHHKEFDFGNLEIVKQTETLIQGRLNGREFLIEFPSASV